MKYSFLFTMVALATAGIVSCTKTKLTNDGPYPIYPPVEQSRSLLSNWMSMPFSEMTSEDGTAYLQADVTVDGVSTADPNTHVAFFYIKMEDAGQITYSKVPITIANDNENFTIGFGLQNGVLSTIVYNNSVAGQTLSIDRFQNCQFRLVMVSAYDYQNLQVDWNDYLAVESALNHSQESVDAE